MNYSNTFNSNSTEKNWQNFVFVHLGVVYICVGSNGTIQGRNTPRRGLGSMTVVTLFNIAMELWGVLICIVCAGGVYVGAIRRTRRTYTKVSMQLLCALMLLADVSAWYHNGGCDKLDFYMTRIGNLGEYLINFIFIALFANYIWQTVSGDDMLENVSPHEWRARTSGGAKRNRKNQRSANAQSKPKKPRSKKLDVIYAASALGIVLTIATQFNHMSTTSTARTTTAADHCSLSRRYWVW